MIETIAFTLFLSCGQVIDHPIKLVQGGAIIGEAGCKKPAEINLLGRELNCKPRYVDGAHEAREPDTRWAIWDGGEFPHGRIVGVNRPWDITTWTSPELPHDSPRLGQGYFVIGDQYNNRSDEWSWDGSQVIAGPDVTWTCNEYAIISATAATNIRIANIKVVGGTILLASSNSSIKKVEITKANIGITQWRADGVMNNVIDSVYVHDTKRGGIVSWSDNVVVKNSTVTNIGVGFTDRSSWGGIVVQDNSRVINNVITHVDYTGIRVSSGSAVHKNTISGFCSTLGDGAGIYAGNSNGATINISKNNISNGYGYQEYGVGAYKCAGLYADLNTQNIHAFRNRLSNVDAGVKIHISHNNNFVDNKCFNCTELFIMSNRSNNNVISWD